MFDNNRLKQRRLDMGLTLEEVGNVVGVSRSAVQKHEKGIIKNVYTSTVELFAKALRCSPAYLMCWTDDPTMDELATNKASFTEAEQELISIYRSVNEEGQEKLLDYADDIASSGKYKKDNTDRMGIEEIQKQA